MSSALEGFLDKWRTRWPEWELLERFVPVAQRQQVVAWFSLLQEFDDILNVSGETIPSDAKLAWWGEELRSWSAQRSKHPLGRVLEPVQAPWAALADTLPSLIEARAAVANPEQAHVALRGYAQAVAAVEAAMFNLPMTDRAAEALLLQTLAQRVQDLGVAAVPLSLAPVSGEVAVVAWGDQLLAQWPARVAGPRPRRIWALLARDRLKARLRGGEHAPNPLGLVWRGWWAARG